MGALGGLRELIARTGAASGEKEGAAGAAAPRALNPPKPPSNPPKPPQG